VTGPAGLAWALSCAVAAALAWAVAVGAGRVRRLDRLHVRVDAARSGLLAALDRRVAAALVAVSTGAGDLATATALRAAATTARTAGPDWPDREAAENRLGRALIALDRHTLPDAVAAELVDAELLVALARRVHNDAVRDTLGLRSRRLVRWLHLAGGAPLPRYFEIADPGPDVTTAARIGPPGRASSGRR
jgi:hypothetical protein